MRSLTATPGFGGRFTAGIRRRRLLSTILFLAILLLAILLPAMLITAARPALAQQPRPQARQITLLAWADYVDPKLLADFSAETGINVAYDTYNDNEAALSRLKGKTADFDVAIMSGQVLGQGIRAGLLRPLGVPEPADIGASWPILADRLKTLDPTGRHGAVYSWGTVGLALNPKKVQERLGAAAPANSWDLLLKPDLAARLKDCGVAIPDNPDEMFAIALAQAGLKPDSREPRDLQRAADALMRVRGAIRRFHAADHINGLAIGEICMAVSTSMDTAQARRQAEEARNGVDIRHVIPREGAPLWFDVLAIPAASTDPEAAGRLVAFLLRPENAARSAAFLGSATGSKAAMALLSPSDTPQSIQIPDDATLRKSFATAPLEGQARQNLLRHWQRIKTGK